MHDDSLFNMLDLAMHASPQHYAIPKPKMARPPAEVEIEFAEQLRQPQRAIRTTSTTTSSSSPSTLPRWAPKSPSSPTFLGFGKGVFEC